MRFAVSVVITVLIAYLLGYYLSVPANPEVKFWREVVERRNREIAQLRNNQPDTPIIFFTGGSSTAFSIDPQIVEDICGLPAFNLGLPIAAGPEYLIHQALESTRPGDILVIGLEPDILASSASEKSPSKFSFAMASAAGSTAEAAGGETFNTSLSLRDRLSLARPGASYLATLVARFVSDKGYRYRTTDIRFRGRIETPVMGAQPATQRNAHALSQYGRDLLNQAKAAAHARGVRLFYAMPWHFTKTEGVVASRQAQAQLNQHIQSIMPVVDDGFFGVADNPKWFSDTPQHLTAEGSKIRSQAVSSTLRRLLKDH